MNINKLSGNNVGSEQTSDESLKNNITGKMIHLLAQAGIECEYAPQSSFYVPGMATLHNHLRNQVSDAAMSKIEDLCALYGALASTSDVTGFCCVLTLYVKTHNHESLTGRITEIGKSLFADYLPQDSSQRPEWLTQMKSGLHDWKLLVNCPSFKKISRVLTLLVTLGCIESQSFKLGEFEVFAVKAQEKQANAVDLIDAIIETVVYFAEGAYMCFVTGSLKPLLFSSSEVVEIEEKYISLMESWEYARNGNLEKYTNTTEAEFDKDLEDMVTKLNDLYKTMPNGVEKKIIQQKWESLSRIRAEWTAVRVSGGLRAAPFAVKVYGDSGVGKSTFADLVMSTIQKASGVPCTSDYVATLNEADKYDSNYRSYITGIKIDDYGNAKSQFWDQSPSEQIIKIVNNIREYAVMADIANKGKITIEPKALVVTTNVEQMHAGITSNNAMSVLRRMHHHIELNVRSEFKTDNMLDSKKVIDKFGNLEQINDIWLVTMKQPIAAGQTKTQDFGDWKILAEDISIFDYLNILIEDVGKHVHHQKCITESFQEPSELIEICPECNKVSQTCKCKYEPQFGARIAAVLTENVNKARMKAEVLQLEAETKIEDYTVKALLEGLKRFSVSPYSNWVNWVPESWIENEYVQMGILSAGKNVIEQDIRIYTTKYLVVLLLVSLILCTVSYKFSMLVAVLGLFYFMICYSGIVRYKTNAYLDEVMKRRDSMSVAFKMARDEHIKVACGLFAGLSVIYGVCQVVRALRSSISFQGSLQPTSEEEIKQRDSEVNVWKQEERKIEVNPHGWSTANEANNAINKSVFRIECDRKFSGCFMLKTNVIVIPKHFLPKTTMKATVSKGQYNKYKFMLNPDFTVQVGSTDMVLCYVPNTGPKPDRCSMIPKEPITGAIMCYMHGLTKDEQLFKTSLMWCREGTPIHNGYQAVVGSHYKLKNIDTFDGMCMSPIISSGLRYSIIGFHIGGIAGTPRGCGMEALRDDFLLALRQLAVLNDCVSIGPQASPLPKTMFGRPVLASEKIHRKSPVNYLTGDCNIEVLGSTVETSTPASKVIETPISKTVEEITGVPNTWGAPKFTQPVKLENGHVDSQKWKPWYESLKYSCNPSSGFDPAILKWAVNDYKSDLFDALNEQEEFWKSDIRPLTDVETVSGIDGKRFIDAMKTSTSMGFPLGGAKSKYMLDLESDEEFACPRTFVPEVWDEVDKLKELCDSDCALPVVFSSSLKDEPTSLTKDKVRVFQASPVTLQILMRKYFLPIGRFMSVNPLLSECAVGINSHGPEWHDLACHMNYHGKDRIIALDYSKYDLRMPQQLTIAASQIFIDIAVWSGNYSKRDLNMMRVISHAVSAPLVDFNGTMLRLHGSNPSGQNMTVYTNSVVNSLLHRMSFGAAYGPNERDQIAKDLGLNRELRFRDLVKLATYGDDAKGSVMKGYDKFNHIQMREFLAENDIVITMPDKESDPVAFMKDDEVDFLKRKNEYSEDLGLIVGKLEEKSLFKSLHSILKSKVVSPLTVSCFNIDSALREWFFHGKDVYEMRRAQMQQIAAAHDLPCEGVDISYEERVEAFKEKYDYKPQSGYVDWDDDEDDFALCGVQEHSAWDLEFDFESEEEETQTSSVEAVSTEELLEEAVIEKLGEPVCQNAVLGNLCFGEVDLIYNSDDVILVIECKRVVGRLSKYKREVKEQAVKYATVMSILRPDCTVYGITYTEYGFELVECFGEPRFPAKYADLLDNVFIDI